MTRGGAARAGGDAHLCVLRIPRAYADDIELFFVEHFSVVDILGLDVKVAGVARECFRVSVGNGDDLGVFALGPSAAVFARDAARGNYANAICS